jgi:hypothetical protein
MEGSKMKYILITLAIGITGCSTMKQARTDFNNFQKTIQLNLNKEAVYKHAYF